MLARFSQREQTHRLCRFLKRHSGLVAAALAVGAIVWMMGGALYQHKMRQHVSDINEYIAASFKRDAGELGTIAGGAAPSNAFIAQIATEVGGGRLLRYKLFDAGGRLKLDTGLDDLAQAGVTVIEHSGAASLVAQRAQPSTRIVSQGDRLVAETLLPVTLGGKVVAVQEFQIDHTDKVAALRREMTLIFGLGFAVAGFAFGVPALGWRRKSATLAKSQKQLEEARLFMTSVFDNVPAAIIVKEAMNLTCVAANKAIADIHVIERDTFIGKRSCEFFDPETARRIEENDRVALASVASEPSVMEARMNTPGRGERVIVSKRLAIRDNNGEPAWLVTILEDVTELRAADERARYLAHHDVLTGLANRACFQSRLEEWLVGGPRKRFALVLFDLDGFKEINDTFGHAAGDQVLRITGRRLSESLGEGAVVARLGGDEYAALVELSRCPSEVESALEEIFEIIQTPIGYEEHSLRIQLSAGVVFSNDDPVAPDLMLREADTALAGRNFELHYQPIVSLDGGQIVSMEALLRWKHPDRGYIPPLDFIPIAEESGLILPLGEIVIAMACEAALEWPPDVRVSVNLSPIQFRDRSLSRKIADILKRAGLPPQRLELEITEATLLENSHDNVAQLNELRATGIRIAMDDFGAGYSSLNYLRNFSFDKIKIDRSYVRGLGSAAGSSGAILDAVLAMAEGLDVATTAEGVETQEQIDILRKAGCTEMQGFFVSRPVPRSEVSSLLKRGVGVIASAA